MKQVKRIDEFKDANGVLKEVEITFADGSKVVYKAEQIERKGNL